MNEISHINNKDGIELTINKLVREPIDSINELVQSASYSVKTALYNFNIDHGIDGYSLSQKYSFFQNHSELLDKLVMGIEIAGIIGLASFFVHKGISQYKSTDTYFMKSQQKKYETIFSNNRKERKRFVKFNRKMNQMFSQFRGHYKNTALRTIIISAVESEHPYETLTEIKKRMNSDMDTEQMINIASRYLPDGKLVKAKFLKQYGSGLFVHNKFQESIQKSLI